MPLRLAVLLCAAGLIATIFAFRAFAPGDMAIPDMAAAASPAGTWQLAGLDGAALEAGPLLILGANGAVNGDTGCNGLAGTYEADADTLGFGPLAMTRRACLDADASAREAAYTLALAASESYLREADRLTLRDADGVALATFAAVPETDPASFACDDGSEIVAVFFESVPPRAYLTRGEGGAMAVHTTLTRTGSGTRYVGGGVDFWNKGDEALVTWRGEELSCEGR